MLFFTSKLSQCYRAINDIRSCLSLTVLLKKKLIFLYIIILLLVLKIFFYKKIIILIQLKNTL